MTESEQARALSAAFPTEPVRPELHQRIENLTPLSPTVTGYKLKFRHVFATFAVLWIGHNIPAAIQVWQTNQQNQGVHTQYWSYTASGKKILEMDAWNSEENLRLHFKGTIKNGRQFDFIILLKNNKKYIYDIKTKTLTIQNRIIKTNYQRTDLFIKALTTTILRTHDTRNFSEINGDPMLRRVYSSGSVTVKDPATGNTYSRDAKGRLTELTVCTNRLPDSLFEPNFPDVQNTIYLAEVDDDTTYTGSLWSSIRVHAMDTLKGEHP